MTNRCYQILLETNSFGSLDKIIKVIKSCKTNKQTNACVKWGITVIGYKFDKVCRLLCFSDFDDFSDAFDWYNSAVITINKYKKTLNLNMN